MTLVASFLAGILAAFSPCILVLFPALVYRFTHTSKEKLLKELTGFSISFIGVFLFVALFLSSILSSTIKQGFQLGIGLLFIVLGVLALTHRFNPLQFPLIKNPFLFGLTFAIIASINPCSFAYLGLLASLTTSKMITSFIFFASGLLIPSVLFVVFGKSLFEKVKKTGHALKMLQQMMNILLILMGIYLVMKITHLEKTDILAASILLGVTFLVLLRAFYFFQTKLTFPKVLLILALLALLVIALWHCDVHIDKVNQAENIFIDNASIAQPTCSASAQECSVCQRCTIIFSVAASIGFLGILWLFFTEKQNRKKQAIQEQNNNIQNKKLSNHKPKKMKT